jgi:hypothetical protein
MARKPKLTELDAIMIAISYVISRGGTAGGPAQVSRPRNDGTWSVFVPFEGKFDPGGAIVLVNDETGEARFLPSL